MLISSGLKLKQAGADRAQNPEGSGKGPLWVPRDIMDDVPGLRDQISVLGWGDGGHTARTSGQDFSLDPTLSLGSTQD